MQIKRTDKGAVILTAKEYLIQIRDLEHALSDKREELRMLEALATSVTAPSGREVVQTSIISDPTGNFGAKIADLKNEIKQQAAEFLEAKQERVRVIENVRSLDSINGSILHKKYVAYKSLNTIARELNYSYEYTRHLHLKALKMAENFILDKDSTP